MESTTQLSFRSGTGGREYVGTTIVFTPTRGFGERLGYGPSITVTLLHFINGVFRVPPGTTLIIGGVEYAVVSVGGIAWRGWFVEVTDPTRVPRRGRTQQVRGIVVKHVP